MNDILENRLKNRRIEFHILQSFPVTCLNRDDVGAPKSAIVGGASRARVSSQCWKRQVRLAMQDEGIKLGVRTKHIEDMLKKRCIELGADEGSAKVASETIAKALVDDTLLFISEAEIEAFAKYAKDKGFEPSELKVKDLAKLARKTLNPAVDGLDIALFGRMVAKAAEMNVEAAASFSHAISTHKVGNEVEFFTALDDFSEDPGSAHMGSLEFNSATYYRYIAINLGQLAKTLKYGGHDASAEELKKAIKTFTKALFVAVPSARQTTQSGASPWEFARVLVREGQGMQVPFEIPVKADRGGGYLEPSKKAMTDYLEKKEQLFGTMFGKQGDYKWGDAAEYSIDNLIDDLQQHVES